METDPEPVQVHALEQGVGQLRLDEERAEPLPSSSSSTTPTTPSTKPHAPEPAKEYRLKAIDWRSPRELKSNTPPKRINIITQNENGPCPLLALCNLLILRGEISIPLDWSTVRYEHLVDLVGDYLLTKNTTQSASQSAEAQANMSQNLADVMNLFPTLQTGLDVNVHFDSPYEFEVTPALLIFDLAGIRLCHGWTVDPQDIETHRIIAKELKSYNKVVESVIRMDDSSSNSGDQSHHEKTLHEGLVCQTFLNTTASQLTYHGLQTLVETMPSRGLAVLFRNNHFSTLYAHPTCGLLTLVTDQGLAIASPLAVWETMSNVEGDSMFLDGVFQETKNISSSELALADHVVQLDKIDMEEQARAWEEAKSQSMRAASSGGSGGGQLILAPAPMTEPVAGPTTEAPSQYDQDLALAMQLQREEEAAHAHEQQQQQQQHQQQQYIQQPLHYGGRPPPARSSSHANQSNNKKSSKDSKDGDCVVC